MKAIFSMIISALMTFAGKILTALYIQGLGFNASQICKLYSTTAWQYPC